MKDKKLLQLLDEYNRIPRTDKDSDLVRFREKRAELVERQETLQETKSKTPWYRKKVLWGAFACVVVIAVALPVTISLFRNGAFGGRDAQEYAVEDASPFSNSSEADEFFGDSTTSPDSAGKTSPSKQQESFSDVSVGSQAKSGFDARLSYKERKSDSSMSIEESNSVNADAEEGYEAMEDVCDAQTGEVIGYYTETSFDDEIRLIREWMFFTAPPEDERFDDLTKEVTIGDQTYLYEEGDEEGLFYYVQYTSGDLTYCVIIECGETVSAEEAIGRIQ